LITPCLAARPPPFAPRDMLRATRADGAPLMLRFDATLMPPELLPHASAYEIIVLRR